MGRLRRTAALGAFVPLLLCAVAGSCQQPVDQMAQARADINAGRMPEAESTLRGYLKTHAPTAEAHFLLGYVLFREKSAKESLAEFTSGAVLQRPSAADLKVVASDYVMLGDYGDADKWFTAVVVEKPDDADAWYLLGRTKFNENNFQASVTCFERSLTLRPRHIESENNLGLALMQVNETDKAEAAFRKAIAWQGSSPTDAQPFLNLGTLMEGQGKVDQALPYLEKAALLAPENPKIHEELAQAYAAELKLSQAQTELEHAVKLAPDTSSLHFKLGQIYRKEGKQDQAAHEFAICAQLNSTHSSAETPNPPR